VAGLLRGDNVTEIEEMRRSGLALSEISRLTGFSRVTVRKYLENPEAPTYGPRKPRPSPLDGYLGYIDQRLSAGVWNAVVLLRELKERGYTGGYTILKDYLQPKREAAYAVAVRRFETAPGVQAQVDWAKAGTQEFSDGSSRALAGFAFTLGFSRAMFSEVATDQKLSTFLSLHEAAFSELGGIPQEILYDRVKTVVLGVDERGETLWNPAFLDFSRYWGFRPRLCSAYRAQTKGKIERGIGYIRKSFLCAVTAADVPDLSRKLHAWVWGVANRRVHGTTHRVVYEAWEEEKGYLHAVAGRCAYPYVEQEKRKVSRDAFIAYRTNRYPVPWQLAGQEVLIQEVMGRVEVLHGGVRVASHTRADGSYQVVLAPEYHLGMPYGEKGRNARKAMVTIRSTSARSSDHGIAGPVVEVRPLSVYEALAGDEASVAGGRR
jgi:transposase